MSSNTRATSEDTQNAAPIIAPEVPDELYVPVLVGTLDENEAIARGLLAAAALDSEERRSILFGTGVPAVSPLRPLPVTPPWFEP